MPKKVDMFVSVGIPTLGREAVLVDTIKVVLAQDYKKFEIIVADQTTNHPIEFLKEVRALARANNQLRYYLIKPDNLPASRNFIASRAKGELILFIDDDVKLKSDFINQHVVAHRNHPEVAVVAGRIEQKNLPLSPYPLYFDKCGLPQGTFNCPSSNSAAMLPGGNHSLSPEVIKKVGGYHTAYKKNAVREESDMGHRLIKDGFQIYYSAEAGLIHLSVPSGGSRVHKPQFDNLRFYMNDLLFMLRTVGTPYLPLAMFRRLRIYSGGSGLISLRRFKRAGLFFIGLIGAVWLLIFEQGNFAAKEVKQIK